MPWSPPWNLRPDPRLDPYRNRVAALTRDGTVAGHVLILTGHLATPINGHLWWRRWDEQKAAQPLIQMLDGFSAHPVVHRDQLDRELSHWSRGEFPLLCELLHVQWLTTDEALKLAPTVFGVDWCLDNDGRVTWSFANT